MDLTGSRILQFRILELIGRGGMGLVYKAEDTKLGRTVALKVLPFFLLPGPKDVARFEREARSAASINHPNLCTVYGFYSTPEFSFIAMEYVEGATLKRVLERDGPMPRDRALAILRSAASALAAAHRQGIVHRDIKSDNIMLTADGGVKVMDFGLALFRDAPGLTKTGEILGTVATMSPEQAQGKPVDLRTDLWSLGVVLFEMLTGEPPFKGDSDMAVLRSVLRDRPMPADADKVRALEPVRYILSTLLEKDPNLRYPTADRLLEDLDRAVRHTGLRLAWRSVRKHAPKASAAFGLAVCLGLAVYIPLRNEARKPAWLKPEAELVRLTSETGEEIGSVSPSGRYLAYSHNLSSLLIKDLATGDIVLEEIRLIPSFMFPLWSRDGSDVLFLAGPIAVHRWGVDWSRMVWKRRQVVVPRDSSLVYHIALSPDNRWITANRHTTAGSSLWLHGIADSSRRCLLRKGPGFMIFSAWHPDSRHVAYYDSRTSGRTAAIRTLDTKSGVTSPELAEVRHYPSHWNSCGLAFSPDGRYLVFPDSVGSSVQLVALRVSGEGMRARGRPKGFTRFPEYQTPLDPAFGGNGDVLGFGIDETVYEVDIAPLDLKQRIIGDATVPILTDKVINRECEWSKDGRRIVYVSRKGNQYDVYLWSRETRRTDRLTNTADNERLPTFVPDDEAIGFLKHGSVYRMPLSGGTAWRVFPPEGDSPPRKVYGYAWGLSTDVLYAVVAPRPGEPENLFPLIRVELGLGKEIRIRQFPVADEPNIEIQRSPDGGRIAYRFTDIRRSLYQTIGVVDLRTGKDRILTEKVGIVPNGEMAWTPDGNALIFRVNEQGGRFFKMDMASGNQAGMAVPKWFEKCMPGQISPTGDEILIYNLKQEKDVYALGGRSFTAK